MTKPPKQKTKERRVMDTDCSTSATCEILALSETQKRFASLFAAYDLINDFIAKQNDKNRTEQQKRVIALVSAFIQAANPSAEATCNTLNKAALTVVDDAITNRDKATTAARIKTLTALTSALTQQNASPEALAKAACTEIKNTEDSAKLIRDSLECVARYLSDPDPVEEVLVACKDFNSFVESAKKSEESLQDLAKSVDLLIKDFECCYCEDARKVLNNVLKKIEQNAEKKHAIKKRIEELDRRCADKGAAA